CCSGSYRAPSTWRIASLCRHSVATSTHSPRYFWLTPISAVTTSWSTPVILVLPSLLYHTAHYNAIPSCHQPRWTQYSSTCRDASFPWPFPGTHHRNDLRRSSLENSFAD